MAGLIGAVYGLTKGLMFLVVFVLAPRMLAFYAAYLVHPIAMWLAFGFYLFNRDKVDVWFDEVTGADKVRL